MVNKAILLTAALLPFLSSVKAQKADNRPNIIYILADDLGYGDISCYNKDSKIRTPNIDRLAANGIKFTNAHSASAVCTPSRYSIMTGRYSWRSKMKYGVLWTYDWPLVEHGRLTVGKFLKNNGYNTALVGKWHLGWTWPIKPGEQLDTTKLGGRGIEQSLVREQKIDFTQPLKNGPLACGFDYQFGLDIPSLPPYCYIENGHVTTKKPLIMKSDSISGYPGLMEQGWDSKKIMPDLFAKAMNYVDENAKSGKPFFLYMPLASPHYPIAPNQPFKQNSKMGDYGAVVEEMDHYIGLLIEKLKKLGIDKNTLIIFTSDNGSTNDAGEPQGHPEWAQYGAGFKIFNHQSNKNFRGIKGDIWDGGHRIPFIASWPRAIPTGKTSNEAISLTDLFATCADIINKPLPDSCADDSYSVLPLLKGQALKKPVRNSVIFQSSGGFLSIEKGKWKYIDCNFSGGTLKSVLINNTTKYDTPGQLYDIVNDPEEKENLYTKYPLVVKELSELLAQQKKSGGTRYLHN